MFIEPVRSSQNVKFAINANTVLQRRLQKRMSEDVGHKVENAITERKRRMKSQKRVYLVKTFIVERRRVHIAKTRQPAQN